MLFFNLIEISEQDVPPITSFHKKGQGNQFGVNG